MRGYLYYVLLVICGITAMLYVAAPEIHAAKDWIDDDIRSQHSQVSLPLASLYTDDCEYKKFSETMGLVGSYCIIQDGDVSFGYNLLGETVVKKRYDTNYYPLASADRYVRISGTGAALGYRTENNGNITLSVYRDIGSRLHFESGKYVFSTENPVFRTAPQDPWAIASSMSKDGRYITLMTLGPVGSSYNYVSRISTETGSAINVGTISGRELMTSGAPVISISADGRYMAAAVRVIDNGAPQNFYTVKVWDTARCGIADVTWCDTRRASDGKALNSLPRVPASVSLSFNETSDQLVVSSFGSSLEPFRTVYSVDELFGDARIDYMALGDSYTSGEGAAIGGYIKGTDVQGSIRQGIPTEKCHLARLSYPFLLADMTLEGRDNMISVACSGAEIGKDYIGKNASYMGQGSRLAGLPSLTRAHYKEDALNISYIPGRNKQIEFVKRYQPRAVTVMGGGNDAGFAKILQECATPGTCPSVQSEKKYLQAKVIQKQYYELVNLYTAINKVSPRTKIYAIGYPQFVSNKSDPCAVDQGLNFEERTFIRHGVSYLNEVTRAAADTVGVAYLDIGNSLDGRNLCSYGKAPLRGSVNGIRPLVPWWGVDLNGWKETLMSFVDPGSYHPNAGGHAQIQRYIIAQLNDRSLLEVNYCRHASDVVCPTRAPLDKVPLPAYFDFGYSSSVQSQSTKVLASQNVQKGTGDMIHVRVDGASAGTSATIRMASTPITLGTVEVDKDGVIDQEYAIPAQADAGYHTLYVDMQSPAGESVTLYEAFLVLGTAGDIDENGVADHDQACPFATLGSQDEFGRSLDEYCLAASNLPDADDSMSTEPAPPVLREHVGSISYSSNTSALPALSPVALALGMKEMPESSPTAAQNGGVISQVPSDGSHISTKAGHKVDQVSESQVVRLVYIVIGVVLCTVLIVVGIFYAKNKKTN